MSEIVTSLLKAVVGLLVNKARDSAAENLRDGDVTANKIRELIQREINDIKSKLDALSRKDLLTAIDAFEVGVRFFCQVQDTDTINGAQAPTLATAVRPAIRSAGFLELGVKVKESMHQAEKRFRMARKEATKAFNNEALDTLQRITAIRYRVMAALLVTTKN